MNFKVKPSIIQNAAQLLSMKDFQGGAEQLLETTQRSVGNTSVLDQANAVPTEKPFFFRTVYQNVRRQAIHRKQFSSVATMVAV